MNNSLLSYLPAQVIKCVLDGKISSDPRYPIEIPLETVSLFADISGFTKLSEKFSKKGRSGAEFLAFFLNKYMELLINIIGTNGGDIFKFAGDALLVIWPSDTNSDLEERCQRAFQCAQTIQNKLNNLDIGSRNPLSVKVGIGVGECRIFFVGGTFNRSEFLIVGSAMKQACSSECHATEGGQIIISEKVYDQIKNKYNFQKCKKDLEHLDTDDMNYYLYIPNNKEKKKNKLKVKSDAFMMMENFSQESLLKNENVLKTFVPAALIDYLDIDNESWCKELRLLTIMFIQLSLDLKDTETPKGRELIQNSILTVQRCVYRTRGSLNKFLMDDKGSVILCCWGLPPFSSPDDPVRAVLSANLILSELKEKFGVNAMIGITTGSCYTGVCGGSAGRREYSLLGEIVNLSARFMQTAIWIYQVQKNNPDFSYHQTKKSIFLDEITKNLIQNKIFCEFRINKELKGFSVTYDHFTPIDEMTNKKINLDLIIKTHRKPKNDPTVELDNSFICIGLKYERNIIKEKYNSLLKDGTSQAILITGMIGSGKSLLLLSELSIIIKKSNNDFLTNLEKIIFISNQNPITYNLNMNAFNESMKKIFKTLLIVNNPEKKNYEIANNIFVEGDLIFNLIYQTNNFKNIHYIEEILDYDLSKHYNVIITHKHKNTNKILEKLDIKELDKINDPFFFERDYEHNKIQIAQFFLLLIDKYKKHILKNKPIIFVIEDCQVIDSLSVEVIKQFLININEYKNIFMLCTFQTSICELKKSDKEKRNKINKTLLDAFDLYGTIIQMKPFLNYIYITDLIRNNINKKLKDENDFMNSNYKLVKDPKDLYENLIIGEVSKEVIDAILPLSFKGNPLFIIELTQTLINQKLIILKFKSNLLLSAEFKKMISLKDYSKIKLPFIIEKVIGNIIDSLDCIEIIILKNASVIGNIFDIEILSHLISFLNITFDELVLILKNFENLGLIEILYDIKINQMVCMFTIPLFREVLYQRMLIEQKTEIHEKIGEKMELLELNYLPKYLEYEILKVHLKNSGKTILNYLEDEEPEKEINKINLKNLKILTVKDIIEKLIAIKNSSETLQNKSMPLIMSSNVIKKDENGLKFEERFAIITNSKFCYYYNESNYNENSQPLGSFYLNDIFQITHSEQNFGNNKFFLEIYVTSWEQKGILRSMREFIFGFDTAEELNKWEIALSFLRFNNMFEEFDENFGMFELPLNPNNILFENQRYRRKLAINKENLNQLIFNKDKIEADKNNLIIINENARNIFLNGFSIFLKEIQDSIINKKNNKFKIID